MRIRLRDDRGSFSLEAAVLFPIPVFLILLAALGGRVQDARGATDAAAFDAARAASISRSADTALANGSSAAKAGLSGNDLHCSDTTVTIDVSEFARPVGQTATVRATVECTVNLADLTGIPGLPGAKRITSTFDSPIDRYRGRS